MSGTATARGVASRRPWAAASPSRRWRPCAITAAKMTAMQTSAIAAAQPRPTATSARTMFSSLAKRLNGGRPSRATRPKPKIPPSTGRRDSRAGTFAISLVPSARRISPEARKSTALARPWPRMCSRTAAIASELPAAAPRAIRPMCSMLW